MSLLKTEVVHLNFHHCIGFYNAKLLMTALMAITSEELH